MNVVIKESKSGVNEEKLVYLEKKIGFSLPENYRNFSIKYNGGYPEPGSFVFFDKNLNRQDGSSVDRFLYIGEKVYGSIENYLRVFDSRVPKSYLPVAHDPGGNLILIKLAGADVGGVFFWDHEFEADPGETPSEKNIYFISNDFNEFLGGLYELEDE